MTKLSTLGEVQLQNQLTSITYNQHKLSQVSYLQAQRPIIEDLPDLWPTTRTISTTVHTHNLSVISNANELSVNLQ